MATISLTLSEEILDLITTPFVALYNGDPATTGTEITGSGYERKDASLGAFASKEKSNTTEIRWTSMPASTVTHLAIFDAATAGNLRVSTSFASPTTLESGDEFFIATGNLTIRAVGG